MEDELKFPAHDQHIYRGLALRFINLVVEYSVRAGMHHEAVYKLKLAWESELDKLRPPAHPLRTGVHEHEVQP